jgi:hypothetical protein
MPAKKSETQKPGLEVTIDPDLRYEQAVKELEKLILDMESGKFSPPPKTSAEAKRNNQSNHRRIDIGKEG